MPTVIIEDIPAQRETIEVSEKARQMAQEYCKDHVTWIKHALNQGTEDERGVVEVLQQVAGAV